MAARLFRVNLLTRLGHAQACAAAASTRLPTRVFLHLSARTDESADLEVQVLPAALPLAEPAPALAASASTEEKSLDQLITRANKARNMHDMEWIVLRLKNNWEIDETTWPRWSAVIDTLGARHDPEMLHMLMRCLLYGKAELRRRYLCTDQLGERIYASIIRAQFLINGRTDQANVRIKHCVNQARLQRIRCDGIINDTLVENSPNGMGGGVQRMLRRAAEDPNVSPRKAMRFLAQLRKGKSLDEVFPHAEHLRGRMMKDMFPQFRDGLFTALLARDAYNPEDVERIGTLLSLPLEQKHWIEAARRALQANDGAAALHVLRRMYDSNFAPENTLVIRAIELHMAPERTPNDEEIQYAVDIMRLHIARGLLHDGAPINLLFALARQHNFPDRLGAVREIIDTYHLHRCLIILREPILSQTLTEVLLSKSHAEAVDAFARYVASPNRERIELITRAILELRFADAQILPIEIFDRLLHLHVAFHGRWTADEISFYLDRVLAVQQRLLVADSGFHSLEPHLTEQISPESLLDTARKVEMMLVKIPRVEEKTPILARLAAIFKNAGAIEDLQRLESLLRVPEEPRGGWPA